MNICRMTDVGKGTCCEGSNHSATGKIISGSPDVYAEGLQVARSGDIITSDCHQRVGTIVADATVYANGLPVATIGDVFVGCFSGRLITGASAVYAGSAFTPSGTFKARGPLNLGPAKGKPGRAYVEPVPETKRVDPVPPPEPPPTPPETSCLRVTEPVPDTFQLSANFKLRDLTTAVALPQSRLAVMAQAGLTVQQIVCNLQAWCENVGEPLIAHVGGRNNIIITSGFRRGSGTSQHNRGQACDVQFPYLTNPEIWDVALWVKANVNFDQLIMEYGGRRPWLHISYNRDGNRPTTAGNKVGTQNYGNNYTWGQIQLKEGNNNVPAKRTT